jgi:putative Mg2+ transporter-C (MgtC) family protein
MSLVSLGSCLFTITSAFAFMSGPMTWDASRVAAAIPSGVGFLGAGLIWKQDEKSQDGSKVMSVHGLTTAASIWLSAAVGIAAGRPS